MSKLINVLRARRAARTTKGYYIRMYPV